MTEFYNTGTIAVENGSTHFAGTDTLWLPSNVKAGDVLNVAGNLMVIESIDGNEQTGEFAIPYPGTTASGLSYSIVKTSASWGINRVLAVQTAELIRLLTVGQQFEWVIALSHEQSEISAQVNLLTMPIPKDIEVQFIEAFVTVPSDSGNVVLDINLDGVSVFSQELTIEEGDQSSEDASEPAVLLNPNWNKGQVMSIDIDTAGSGAEGAKIIISGQRRS